MSSPVAGLKDYRLEVVPRHIMYQQSRLEGVMYDTKVLQMYEKPFWALRNLSGHLVNNFTEDGHQYDITPILNIYN